MRRTDYAHVSPWETFKRLCRLLAPSPPRVPPDLSRWDWETFVHQASVHLVTPALAMPLDRWATAPAEVRQYFIAFHDLNDKRNKTALGAVSEMLAGLREIGVEAIALKGVASLIAGLYDDPADRFMGDVDILVRPAQVSEAAARLRELGYTRTNSEEPAHRWVVPPQRGPTHHLEMQRHLRTGVGVELHHGLFAAEFDEVLPAADVFDGAAKVEWNGQNIFIPSPTHRLVHNIAHDQLHHSRYSRGLIQLRQLRELALILSRHGGTIAWPEVEERFDRVGQAPVLRRQAAQCFALMGLRMPIEQTSPEEAESLLRARMTENLSRHAVRRAVTRKLGRFYLDSFAAQPALALNLLNPAWWPQRIRHVRDYLRYQRLDN